jgi:phosphoribosylanthranilate isomerase
LLAGGRHGLQVIGVFVNAATDEILEIAEACQLDWIQLHGDEPPEQIRQLAPWPVIRALPYGDAGLAPIRAHLDACDGAGRLPAALLLDAAAPGMYGGTGKPLPWQRLAKELPVRDALPWILAGGLTPVNVKQAIELLNPDAVDTASGVESSPGEKNAQLTRDFVAAVRQASSGDGR